MSCSGNMKKAMFISWGPKNMRAWKLHWCDDVWKSICDCIHFVRNFDHDNHLATVGEFKDYHRLASRMKDCCNQAVVNAELVYDSKK